VKQSIQSAIRSLHCTFFHRAIPEKIGIYCHSLAGQHSKLDGFLARFLEMGYSFVGPEAFVSGTGRLIFLSFDDNYRSWLDGLSVFERHGVKATFYVNTFPFRDVASAFDIQQYLADVDAEGETTISREELREIAAAGHRIGAHTHTHPVLTAIPFERAKEEIRISKQIVEDILQRKVTDFAYPFGLRKYFSSELRRYCLKIGFETIANAIPCMQFAISRSEDIHRSVWFFEYPFGYNLDNVCIDGRAFERVTARSAVGGRLDSVNKEFNRKVMTGSRIRVTLLTNAPAPYRLPILQELNRLCDLTVLYDALREPNRHWEVHTNQFQFRYRILRGFFISYTRRRESVRDQRFMHFRYDIIPRLFWLRPDVVVSGEMGPRSLQAAYYCRLTKTPFIIWSEGTPYTERSLSKVRLLARKWLVRQATRFWSNGKEVTMLLESYGADLANIDDGMTGINTTALSSEVNKLISSRSELRSALCVDGIVFLFVGQLIERKGILQYLKALDLVYRDIRKNWSALFVGSGEYEVDLRNWANDHPEVRVVITGFVKPSELPRYLAVADAFVLPTLDDNWPLASLEALAAGLPQLFSIYNGGTADLLVPGITGKVVDPKKTDEFAAAIREWIEAPPRRLSSEDIGHIVEYYSPPAVAQRGLAALKKSKLIGPPGKAF
jgi:glycosyltransferase involved in cell wall biosynthesis